MNNTGNNSSNLGDVGNNSQSKIRYRNFQNNKIKYMHPKERDKEHYFQKG